MNLRQRLFKLMDRAAQVVCGPIYMAGYAAGYGQGHFDGWAEHANLDDDREDIFSRSFLEGGPKRACRVCGCTKFNACVDERGPCWWVDGDLCSHCLGTFKLPGSQKAGKSDRIVELCVSDNGFWATPSNSYGSFFSFNRGMVG